MKPSSFTLPTEMATPAPEPVGPFRSFADLIADHARERPQSMALVTDDGSMTYQALDQMADRVASALQRDGCTARGVVAICARNSSAYLALWAGAIRAGLAVAPIAPGSTVAQLLGMVRDSGATHLFVDSAVASALSSSDVPCRVVGIDAHPGLATLAQWLAPEGSRPQRVDVQEDWTFNIIYSSGTTGAPKGIVHSGSLRWTQIWRGVSSEYGPDAITLISTPLYSNTTLVSVLPTLGLGGCIVLMTKFEVRQYLELAQRHRVTHAMLVPVQYQRLMAFADFDDYDLSSFRYKFCTSAPFAAALKADVLRRWPGALIEYYGMTEGGGVCILQAHLSPDKLHTVGQPLAGSEMRLIDEDGREVPQGAIGEVVGRSSMVMQGYHNQPEKTAQTKWFDAQGNEYIRNGDVGRFDADGYLILMDRRKDMIISGGFNVYPSDLEAELVQHPAVAEVAVVGVPSTDWGETPVAYVVRHAGNHSTEEQLRQEVNARLGKMQRIADLRFIEELPRSAIGKILKRELRDAYVRASQP